MAKRKSYRGTQKEHAAYAVSYAVQARRYAQKLQRSLTSGDCHAAISNLEILNQLVGKADAHRLSRGKSKYGKGGASLYRVSTRLGRKFAQKCLR